MLDLNPVSMTQVIELIEFFPGHLIVDPVNTGMIFAKRTVITHLKLLSEKLSDHGAFSWMFYLRS